VEIQRTRGIGVSRLGAVRARKRARMKEFGMNIVEYIFTIFVFTLCFCGLLILFLLLAVLNPQF
jgi:hypothetical protein